MSTATKAKPKIKIHPLDDRVVILPADEAETMRGPLYIPDTAKEKPTQGEVLAVGPGRFEKGERVKMDLGVGDTGDLQEVQRHALQGGRRRADHHQGNRHSGQARLTRTIRED